MAAVRPESPPQAQTVVAAVAIKARAALTAPMQVAAQTPTAPAAPIQASTPHQGEAVGRAAAPLRAQSAAGQATVAQTLTATADKLAFEVASVKPSKAGERPYSNFPLGPGDVYVPNGGYFSATNMPLIIYISFAYKIKGNQMQYLLPQLPGWVTADRFDIQARANGNPGKDQMRLMMRTLLADRFKLAIHNETRQVPLFALVLLKPGATGHQLHPHAGDSACPTTAPPPSAPGSAQTPSPSLTVAGGFPALCGGIVQMPPVVPGRMRVGARNVTIGFIADSLSAAADLGRPMLDQTRLSGTFDFILEWTREVHDPLPPGADVQPEPAGPDFQAALREQLGLKLESQKGPVDILVVDHVEHPSEN